MFHKLTLGGTGVRGYGGARLPLPFRFPAVSSLYYSRTPVPSYPRTPENWSRRSLRKLSSLIDSCDYCEHSWVFDKSRVRYSLCPTFGVQFTVAGWSVGGVMRQHSTRRRAFVHRCFRAVGWSSGVLKRIFLHVTFGKKQS